MNKYKIYSLMLIFTGIVSVFSNNILYLKSQVILFTIALILINHIISRKGND